MYSIFHICSHVEVQVLNPKTVIVNKIASSLQSLYHINLEIKSTKLL